MSEQIDEKKEAEESVTKSYLDKKLDEKLEAFVTKDYLDKKLDEKLEAFVTKDYLDKKLEAFATKEYLDEKLDIVQAHLDERLDQFRDEIREDMREQTATLLQVVDRVMTRYDAAEKDQAGHNALHHRITDDIHEHDDRIKKLEVAMS